MNINDAFPSKYLKASDLPEEGSQTVTIEKIDMEEIGPRKESKPVIHFEELDKTFVCNKTNAKSIARMLQSEEFDDWIGQKIALYRADVEFQGDMVEAIRVKNPMTKKPKKKQTEETDEKIPF